MERLRALRQQRVLTLRELEERSGVAYNTIWHLENGKRGAQPRTIRKLADALGVAPEELVRVEGSDASHERPRFERGYPLRPRLHRRAGQERLFPRPTARRLARLL